jgi:hypothetical protein
MSVNLRDVPVAGSCFTIRDDQVLYVHPENFITQTRRIVEHARARNQTRQNEKLGAVGE